MSREALPPRLHELEARVMEHVWSAGEMTVRAVLDALNRGERSPRAYTTILTTMTRLERKGLLRRRREGRGDVYSPAIDRDAYLDRRADAGVEDLVDEFGDAALVHFARRIGRLAPERREQLRRLAEGEHA